MKVWIDGAVVDANQARVSVLDHGLLYGDGVFEGIRASHGRVVDLELHLQRLQVSARMLSLQAPPSSQLRTIVLDTLEAHGKPSAYVRLVVTRGVGNLGIDVEGCSPTTFCIVGDIAVIPEDKREHGIRLATASQRRPQPDVLDPSVKSLNYLNNVLARIEAKRNGAEDALVLNHRGLVAETSSANVFVLRGEQLLTPPTTDGGLPGLTRRRILRLAPELGLLPLEASLSRYDLIAADEVMVTGTGLGLVRVRSIDGQSIGSQDLEGASKASLPARFAPLLKHDALQHGVPIAGFGARAPTSS